MEGLEAETVKARDWSAISQRAKEMKNDKVKKTTNVEKEKKDAKSKEKDAELERSASQRARIIALGRRNRPKANTRRSPRDILGR